MSRIGLSVAAFIFFVLIIAYWMITPKAERLWIPAPFALAFGIIAFQDWRRGRAKAKEDGNSRDTSRN